MEENKKPVKRKSNGRNSPVIGDNGLNVNPGDNAKFLAVSMVLFNMDKVDMKDPVAVQDRLDEYFKLYNDNDMKPTVAGMAMALGMDRRRLWEIKTGVENRNESLPQSVRDVIKKAYFLMENLWETYMNSGKINPVSGIFLGKNNFAYQDKTEYVLTPNQQQDNDYDADDIRKRYLIDGKKE